MVSQKIEPTPPPAAAIAAADVSASLTPPSTPATAHALFEKHPKATSADLGRLLALHAGSDMRVLATIDAAIENARRERGKTADGSGLSDLVVTQSRFMSPAQAKIESERNAFVKTTRAFITEAVKQNRVASNHVVLVAPYNLTPTATDFFAKASAPPSGTSSLPRTPSARSTTRAAVSSPATATCSRSTPRRTRSRVRPWATRSPPQSTTHRSCSTLAPPRSRCSPFARNFSNWARAKLSSR